MTRGPISSGGPTPWSTSGTTREEWRAESRGRDAFLLLPPGVHASRLSRMSAGDFDNGHSKQGQPKGGCYAKDYGSNIVREYDTLLHPPDPVVDDPTLGVKDGEQAEAES